MAQTKEQKQRGALARAKTRFANYETLTVVEKPTKGKYTESEKKALIIAVQREIQNLEAKLSHTTSY